MRGATLANEKNNTMPAAEILILINQKLFFPDPKTRDNTSKTVLCKAVD